jgi:hypothetical protein
VPSSASIALGRRFVGVFDFKSVLISAGAGAALNPELKRILAIYQEATARCDRRVANLDLPKMGVDGG